MHLVVPVCKYAVKAYGKLGGIDTSYHASGEQNVLTALPLNPYAVTRSRQTSGGESRPSLIRQTTGLIRHFFSPD